MNTQLKPLCKKLNMLKGIKEGKGGKNGKVSSLSDFWNGGEKWQKHYI